MIEVGIRKFCFEKEFKGIFVVLPKVAIDQIALISKNEVETQF